MFTSDFAKGSQISEAYIICLVLFLLLFVGCAHGHHFHLQVLMKGAVKQKEAYLIDFHCISVMFVKQNKKRLVCETENSLEC